MRQILFALDKDDRPTDSFHLIAQFNCQRGDCPCEYSPFYPSNSTETQPLEDESEWDDWAPNIYQQFLY